ncbi:MAG: transglutaminaseTgpA domain-containing protein, partial [Myxococcota bacterium]
MRFAHAHKLTTYLMVLSAFFALALSGELSLIAVTLAFIGIIGSWLWEPPRIRFERFNTAWTILSVLILAYTLLSAFIGSDYLLIGSEFLLYLLIAKLFNRRSCKDYMHVYVITFLMLVAGTVLNSEFSYGFFFLGYVVTATWALILFHLRREMEDNFLLKHSDARPSERVEV